MAESRTGPKFGQPTLFLFLVYFSFTSPFLLDLHGAFLTCSMTNTTVTSYAKTRLQLATNHCHLQRRNFISGSARAPPPPNHGLSPSPNDGKKRGKKSEEKTLVVSTHAIPYIFKNVPPLFSSVQQSIKYYYHCSDIRNAYVNDMLPILYQRSTVTAFDKLSYSFRTSIAKYLPILI